jgi:RNA polymerase sigma-70 factor, ECF subfamily
MEQPSDEVLIGKCKGGDMAAFKMLVVRHEGKVAGVIRSMLGPTPEAEDVGQEVFIRFYDALGKFRGEAQVGTYLIRIAINLSLNELKKKKRTSARFVNMDAAANKGSEDMMDLNEQLNFEFSQLEPEFQMVATLRLIEGYSTEETSDILSIPIGTVLSRLARAQQKLRVALSKKLR